MFTRDEDGAVVERPRRAVPVLAARGWFGDGEPRRRDDGDVHCPTPLRSVRLGAHALPAGHLAQTLIPARGIDPSSPDRGIRGGRVVSAWPRYGRHLRYGGGCRRKPAPARRVEVPADPHRRLRRIDGRGARSPRVHRPDVGRTRSPRTRGDIRLARSPSGHGQGVGTTLTATTERSARPRQGVSPDRGNRCGTRLGGQGGG